MPPGGTLTVLFTDLVGSTSLLIELGEERFEAVLSEHDALVAEAISSHRGELVKHTGDGAMAVFSGAADGLDAAVALQQAIERRNRRSDTKLAVRMGLSTGDVSEQDGDYFGRVPVEARRLCDAADGDHILAADVIPILAGTRGEHSFVALGALELKGLPPLSAVEVSWDPAVIEPPAGVTMAARLAMMSEVGVIGREAEAARLADAYKHVATGAGQQTVFLVGEAGIGKSTLASVAGRDAYGADASVLYGRCDDGLGQPYQPFVEALDHLVPNIGLDILERHISAHGGELTRILPSLRERVPEIPAPRATDPEAGRYLLLSAVVGLLSLVAQTRPALLVLDDLHWADRETLVLLRHIVCSPVDLRLLLVPTYRDTDLGSGHPLIQTLVLLRREPQVDRISMAGLHGAQVVGLVQH